MGKTTGTEECERDIEIVSAQEASDRQSIERSGKGRAVTFHEGSQNRERAAIQKRTANNRGENDGGGENDDRGGNGDRDKNDGQDKIGASKRKWTLDDLLELGKKLDQPTTIPAYCREVVGVGEFRMPEGDKWVEENLKIRSKLGAVTRIQLNLAQLRYSYDCAQKRSTRNIVLKARQVGMTSYIAARFFVQTVTRPGTLTMLVAHDRESAEEIFRIVQPGRMKLAEDRIMALERNDIKRNVYDRIVTATIAFAVSALITLHDRFLPK